jgi:hypothetical protein
VAPAVSHDGGVYSEGVRSVRIYSFPVGYAEDPEGLVTFTRFSW